MGVQKGVQNPWKSLDGQKTPIFAIFGILAKIDIFGGYGKTPGLDMPRAYLNPSKAFLW